MKTPDYLKGEKVRFTSQFHSFLEPCLCEFHLETRGLLPPFMHMHHFDTQGTPDGQFTGWVLERILSTILFSNPWMGALAFQLMPAILIPTDLRIDVIKGSSFPALSDTSVL